MSEIALVSVGRVRLRAVAEAHPGPSLRPYTADAHRLACVPNALAGLLVELPGQ